MSRLRPLILPALFLALLPACQDKPAEQAEQANEAEPGVAEVEEVEEPKPEPEPVDTAPPDPNAVPESELDAGEELEPPPPLPEAFDEVGVEACDAYVARYVACIGEKVPEAEREAQRRIVFEQVSAWKQTAAGGPAAEKGLQTACKIATEQAKRATQEWGCEW